MLCFAYGSNMSTQRLAARIPARFVTTALLPAHRLAFHQQSGDGSGKCDIVPAPDQSAVYGVVWEVAWHHKLILDRYEGLNAAYDETKLTVTDLAGEGQFEVQAYVGKNTATGIRPYTWYKHHVLAGAREHQLPAAYVRALERVEAQIDPDTERHAREMVLHGINEPLVR
ncbi:gamma-glutamylcyclotransferase family protein [Halovibrio sp. HP20-50]|uniref:gamma-glutamylcyclotransferase family protein n=1 Tax=Halovibrio sp. HP20-59 TaxID=3080275 RepID=UPI00294AD4C5|nr:gamma-glutamylcyclotransferase family protein [Halovibrio sp. HP20-59]MEA2117411.1 gamma-glutamylcyclotransferase family protein [Halovibrio sp. HP20-59]